MLIRSVEFITSAVRPAQYPDTGIPEVAFVGRSNVGKSSLLNKLVNRRHMARTSGQPGKTQLINFFAINEAFYLVDLPGYGYAKVSKDLQATWAPMAEAYLQRRETLRLVIQLVDLRHEPTLNDRQMYTWLSHFGRPPLIVATKADKLSRAAQSKNARVIRQVMDLPGDAPMVITSSGTGYGMDELWGHIEQVVHEGTDSSL
ncbi:MAG: ribosome biogenesis GTP-binding protein YihA/YsxC [Firmicutes bacterium]|nr:ribosome biogenesis GTP-binding protein YihA/YsxC [Bacillota bacterium]